MRIPRSLVDSYGMMLGEIGERGKSELVRVLSAIDFTSSVEDVRNEVIAAMQMCCGASSTMAARLAAEFYDGLRESFGFDDGFTAVVDSGRDPKATEGAVKAFVQDLVDEKPLDQLIGKCVDRLDYEARLAANKCTERNARCDPKKPMWARVPTGVETCEFCIMLASRGFAYHSEETASHAHANCDCLVIPSWDKKSAEVEGYDPDYYYRIWRRLDGAEVIHEKLYDETPSEVRREREEIDNAISRAWNQYLEDGGEASPYQSTVGAYVSSLSHNGRLSVEDHVDLKRRGHEPQLGSWLANAGHEVRLRIPRGNTDTNDAVIDSETWEFKRLLTRSTKKFRRRITEKLPRQGPNFVVDLSEGGLDRKTAELVIAELLEDEHIEKVLLVKNGSAKLFTK